MHSNGNSIINVVANHGFSSAMFVYQVDQVSYIYNNVWKVPRRNLLQQHHSLSTFALHRCPGQRKVPWPQQFNVCEDLIKGWKGRSVKECKGILDFGRSWQGPSDFFSCNPFNISSRGQCPRAAETGHNLILPGFLHMLRYFPIGLKLDFRLVDFPLLCPLIQTFYSKTTPAATTHCTDALAVYAVWTTKKNHTRLNISTCVKT